MSYDTQSKVQARHLKRSAFLYVRQSSLRQVFENSESTKRQYDLRQRAISLGWRTDRSPGSIFWPYGIDPPWSPPSAKSTSPSATRTALPDDEPPAE
jgi:hypothetical protein